MARHGASVANIPTALDLNLRTDDVHSSQHTDRAIGPSCGVLQKSTCPVCRAVITEEAVEASSDHPFLPLQSVTIENVRELSKVRRTNGRFYMMYISSIDTFKLSIQTLGRPEDSRF